MWNKDVFFNKMKDEIFKSKRYESIIADMRKEKNIVNEEIKKYISVNKMMFKKKRLSDIFTDRFLIAGAFLFPASLIMLITFLSITFPKDINQELPFDVMTFSYFSIFIFFAPIFFNVKSKKNKFLSNLKCLHKKKNMLASLLKNVDFEKENVEEMLKDFEHNNSDSNKEIMNFPISIDIIKSMGNYFSEKEIERIMFDKDNEAITYYDLIKFVYKNENLENIKKKTHHIKEIMQNKDVIAYN